MESLYTDFKHSPKQTSSKLSIEQRDSQTAGSQGASGKKLSAAGALLKEKHPELFFVAPRPGGFVRHVTPPHRDYSKPHLEQENSIEQFQIRRPTVVAVSDASPVSIKEILTTRIPCPNFHKISKDEERDNVVRMCSTAISTVMLLAQHAWDDITLEHIRHTEGYFRALKQDDGYPRNIGQLMQVLANLKKSGAIVSPPANRIESDEEIDAEDVQISELIN